MLGEDRLLVEDEAEERRAAAGRKLLWKELERLLDLEAADRT